MADKELIIRCEDGKSFISVDKFENESMYYITTYKSYKRKGFRDRMIDAWGVLLGFENVDAELVISAKDFEKLKKF